MLLCVSEYYFAARINYAIITLYLRKWESSLQIKYYYNIRWWNYNGSTTECYKRILRNNVYFGLSFGAVNLLNTYSRFKIVWYRWLIGLELHIKWTCRATSDSDLYFSMSEFFKTSFWVQNHPLNLFSQVVNSQRLFCIQKAGVICSY